jgi:hypothetical protein
MSEISCIPTLSESARNYKRYLLVARAIGEENVKSYSCFINLTKDQQEYLITKEIATGFQTQSFGLDAGAY